MSGARGRFRLWRLRRAYRHLAKVEAPVIATPEAAEMRVRFARQTARISDVGQKLHGWRRADRRRFKRQLLA